MPRRHILTERQRHALLALPSDESPLLEHYTLAEDDLEHIRHRRRPHNRFGFALQLCALRYPGRLLSPGEIIPQEVLRFLAAQLGLKADDLLPYASREETRHEHLALLRGIYGYKTFSGRGARALKSWLGSQAEQARSNEDLARRFVDRCRRSQTILPSVSTIERLCADALVDAERRIETRIAARLNRSVRERLDALLTEMVDDRVTRFVWLRKFEVGGNSAAAVRLLERLEFLRTIDLLPVVLTDIPPHWVARLRRQGERYFADGLRDISGHRRLAILAVCVVEWKAAIADAVVETHDRIVGKTWREAKQLSDARVDDAKTVLPRILRTFKGLGIALLESQNDGAALERAVLSGPGWSGLRDLVEAATRLTDAMAVEPLGHVVRGYARFRRYAPRMLRALEIEAAPVATPLLEAACLIRDCQNVRDRPTGFMRGKSKWRRLLSAQRDDGRLWQVAVLFHLRDAFRSGDLWLRHSRRFTDAFPHLRTGAPCKDRIGLLNVLLAEGINLGLSKMAEASNTHEYWELMRLSRWHIEGDAINRALAMVVEAQAQLPMARHWGLGLTASSDGQFFPTARQGEAMNLVNAKYGHEPGLKAYTHLSDQFAPFATQTIPATVHEAPHILDGLLMNEAGRRVREQYADTGGFTDHVFAVTALLGYQFIPRIRDLPSKRLHVFDPRGVAHELRVLIGSKVRTELIAANGRTCCEVSPPWSPEPLLRASCCASSLPTRASTTLPWRCASGAKARFETGPPRASTTAWPASICSPRSSSTEHPGPGRGCPAAKTRRNARRARTPGTPLTARMGPYPAHRRIPVAEKMLIGP